MIEIPEAVVLARQINETIVGKRIMKVVAAKSPHKFAWYYGDPQEYGNVLTGRTITGASAFGGLVEIHAENAAILLGDGVVLRFRTADETTPDKHQLSLSLMMVLLYLRQFKCMEPSGVSKTGSTRIRIIRWQRKNRRLFQMSSIRPTLNAFSVNLESTS